MSCRLICAALLLAASVPAQDPWKKLDKELVARVQPMIASDQASGAAWGGFLAQRYRLKAAGPALVTALARWRDVKGMEGRLVRLHLLDGLLGAGTRVKARQVEFLLADPLTRQGAFALLGRTPAANKQAILRVAMAPAEDSDPVRQCAAQVLIDFRLYSSDYTRYLLENLACTLCVDVVDSGSTIGGWNSAVGQSEQPKLERRRGWPRLVKLRLRASHTAQESLTVAAPAFGGEALSIHRQLGAAYFENELVRGEFSPAPSRYVIEKALGRMAYREIDSQKHLELSWVDARSFVERASAEGKAMAASLDQFLAKLRTSRWLDDEDLPGYRIPIEWQVVDRRSDKTVALPELPPIRTRD